MIPKNAYVLYCLDKNGKAEMHYPRYYDENMMGRIHLETEGEKPKDPYMYDYKDVEEYIRKHLAGKFVKCLISKLVDLVSIEISSCYKENK